MNHRARFWLFSIATLPLLNGCTAPGMIASAGAGMGTAAVQERGIGGAADDASIRAEINHLYLQKDLNDLFKNISIDVMEGRVMLTGSVNHAQTKQTATELAWRPKGVKEVINEIETVGAEGIQDYSADTYISSAIKGRMLLEKDVRSINYTVETVNQKAYILGIARNQEELQKVATIASTTKYVKEVITHIILQDDPRRGTKSKPSAAATGSTQDRNMQPVRNSSASGYQESTTTPASTGNGGFQDSYDSSASHDNVSSSTSMYGNSQGGVSSTELAPPMR